MRNYNNKKVNSKQTTTEQEQDTTTIYKGKFVICLYDDDDLLVAEFNNPKELAEYLQKNVVVVKSIISQILSKKRNNRIVMDRKFVNLELVNITEQESGVC